MIKYTNLILMGILITIVLICGVIMVLYLGEWKGGMMQVEPYQDPTDPRFKMDEAMKDTILREIKASLEFDKSKSDADIAVIMEIYNKYFDNDVYTKLKDIDNRSKDFIAKSELLYPQETDPDKALNFDIETYQKLNFYLKPQATPPQSV